MSITCVPPQRGMYAAKTFRQGASVVAAPDRARLGKTGAGARPVQNRCVSCVRAPSRHEPPRVVEEHATLDPCRGCIYRLVRYRQLRIHRTSVTNPSDGWRCADAIEQPGRDDAYAEPHSDAGADSHAFSQSVDGKRHRSRAGYRFAQSGALQRPADYRYCELREQTQYLVLRSGAARNRRRCRYGHPAG
jgi:hypothetical protein